jgi:hypothetical protein
MRTVHSRSLALLLVILVASAGGRSAAAPAPPFTPAAERRDAAVPSVPSGRVWIGREHEFEEFIRTAPIVRVRDLPAGVTRSVRAYFAPGGLAGSVVFKTMSPRQSRGYFESYKSEIAAYRLDPRSNGACAIR